MPYITASIIMQLLGVVIPKLEEWQNEGQTGQKKITQWTRYLTVALALMQSTAFVFVLKSGNGGLLGQSYEQASRRLQAARSRLHRVESRAHHPHLDGRYRDGDVAGRAHHPARDRQRHVDPDLRVGACRACRSSSARSGSRRGRFKFVVILVIAFFMIVAIVVVESGQRRIPVQFAKRVVGRRMYGGQSTYIPLKVNQSGVIPVIFASSLLSFPAIVATVLPWDGAKTWINDNLVGTARLSWFYIRRLRGC